MDQSEEIHQAENGQAVEHLATALESEQPQHRKPARSKLRGFGSVFRVRWRDKSTGEMRQSPNWSIRYCQNGRVIRELTPFTKESDARKLLKKRLAAITAGKPVGPDIEKTTFEHLATMLLDDYKANHRRSIARAEDSINHLREFFGESRALEITADRVTAYIAMRQEQG